MLQITWDTGLFKIKLILTKIHWTILITPFSVFKYILVKNIAFTLFYFYLNQFSLNHKPYHLNISGTKLFTKYNSAKYCYVTYCFFWYRTVVHGEKHNQNSKILRQQEVTNFKMASKMPTKQLSPTTFILRKQDWFLPIFVPYIIYYYTFRILEYIYKINFIYF